MHRSADDLLYDSEAALRLVTTALHELHGPAAESEEDTPDPAEGAGPVQGAGADDTGEHRDT